MIPEIFNPILVRPNQPDFSDLPWDLPLDKWEKICPRLENLPRGLSRHTVVFVRYESTSYAIKELPPHTAHLEYANLLRLEERHLPAVTPVGYAEIQPRSRQTSILITRYLDHSIPYRSLFMGDHLSRYRNFLLDAIAGLLVQLHLSGIYWGDCSLSNTLFKRDAGFLQAYLVDAETSQVFSKKTPPSYRHDDLIIMEENLSGDIGDFTSELSMRNATLKETGSYVRMKYQRLWAEITKDIMIHPGEYYRIQERVRALNALGFSIGDMELIETDRGDQLRLHVAVTDRNYHRNQLQKLTSLFTEEMQARQLINEIHEVKTELSYKQNHSTSLDQAAQYWLENYYLPVIEKLNPYLDKKSDPAELYCQVLENKWYLSEKAKRDVGHQASTDDFIWNYLNDTKTYQLDSV
jgi:hypothetical protein